MPQMIVKVVSFKTSPLSGIDNALEIDHVIIVNP